MYSKLRQEKTFLETVNYNKTICPICKRQGQYKTNLKTGDLECECGLIIQTSHKYCAGQPINTELSYMHIRRHKK